MKAPDTPQEEQARLNTLCDLNILDTASEERFDRLTRMAKRVFDVPIALVSIVDENRQWFKSCVGLGASETPRDISFCGHAILGEELFVIPNALEDERFADNPLVVDEPHIRFYAGCPLLVNGYRLGTLCIIDREPRNFSSEDLQVLKDLAGMVEQELSAVQLATQDDLTAILNRRGFMMLAKHSLNVCVRHKMRASLVVFDLDYFKAINDDHGHAEGDRVLNTFAQHLQTVCRESDLCARIGGDEFLVLLIDTPADQAAVFIDRLTQSLQKDGGQQDRDYSIGFSAGVVEFDPEQPVQIDDLLSAGDAQMYESKQAKR